MMNHIFKETVDFCGNFIDMVSSSTLVDQQQTNEAFSEKWREYESTNEKNKFYDMQKNWYLKLYGFKNEGELADFLSKKKFIFDAGCGLGYKAKWFADLSPDSIVIGMDFSEACEIAADNYKDVKNLYFIRGDIADVPFHDGAIDYVNCDQVIMHTEVPENTFKELSRITKKGGEFACYVYAKKALPRELLDDYFRVETKGLTNEEIWELSSQLTSLGKILSDLKLEIDVPDIPLLGIKGGKQDIQRFIYWNFLKCYWNEEQGRSNSEMINFDWYSPSNAKRYTKEEYMNMVSDNGLEVKHFHQEEACYSGRFSK